MKNANLFTLAGEVIPVYKTGKPKTSELPKFTSSLETEQYLREIWQAHCTDINVSETFVALYINRANKLIGWEIISKGSASACVVDIQNIIRSALNLGAQAISLAHNHPSGNATPSESDRKITQKAKQAAALFDITLLDHIILTPEPGKYFGFADNDLI